MPDLDDVAAADEDDERIQALRSVLRSNGIGGAAPFTIEGEIQQFGHVAGGARRTGWRRVMAYVMVALVGVPLALLVAAEAVAAVSRLVG